MKKLESQQITFLFIFFLFFNFAHILSLKTSKNLKSKTLTKSLSESEGIELMKKYQPVVYFHSDEKYFPTAIESFNIDWTKVTYDDKNAVYDTNGYKGERTLKQSAPVYVSILENTDGTIRISYLFLFGWNDSGPEIKFKAKAVGLDVQKTIVAGDYGLDLHYSDVEHIEIVLASDKSTINSLTYAFHQWKNKYSKSEITWEGTHPVVYSALGSHACYKDGGDINYKTMWNESKKELGVTIYSTYLKLVDRCEASANPKTRWFSTNQRLLKLNGSATSNISTDEYNLAFKYSGRLGLKYDNVRWDSFKSAINYNTVMKILKVLSKSLYNKIDNAMDELEGLFESNATSGFYGRSYW